MAVVKPFSGWHYNENKFPKLEDVVVPPYDVISDSELKAMREKNPFNYSKIILPEGENKHASAASFFHQWQKEEVLIQDRKPALYFYKQTFKLTPMELFCQNIADQKSDGQLSRTGLFCRVGLEDYSSKVILPHEKTFSGPKADRYKLMEAVQGNMEPVFLGYDSPRFSGDEFEKIVVGQKPTYRFTDNLGVIHELWAITDEKVHEEVETILNPKKFYILDGHHRYETALKFYRDHQSADARLDHRYVLAAICSFHQPGTVILPTHRAIKKGDIEGAKKNWVAQGWQWQSVAKRGELEELLRGSTTAAFGLKIHKTEGYVFLKSKDSKDKLDLEILHEDLLPSLGSPQEIDYIKDIGELESKVVEGVYDIGFLVKPSSVDEVMKVAEAGAVMPHKSTFFYPKIPSGLVINSFT
jgi:uncharacterized protein (DUF1015 family)